MAVEIKSEYILSLNVDSRKRYESKLMSTGLCKDPYALKVDAWCREPDKLPNIAWSDVMMYMVCTPSPHTKEEIKVQLTVYSRVVIMIYKAWKGTLDAEGFVAAGWVHNMSRRFIDIW